MIHDRKNLALLFLQPILIAFLIIMVFVHSAPLYEITDLVDSDIELSQQVMASGDYDKNVENGKHEAKRMKDMGMSVAMMIFTAIWLGTSNSIREIVKELAIYKRERLVNLKVGPYLMSKIFIMAIICLLQTLILVSMVTVGLGLPKFSANVFAFFIIAMASVMMGLAVSAAVSNSDKAMSLAPVLLVPQIILSGAMVPIASVKPEIFQKIFYLAISKWGYELVGGGILDINNRVMVDEKMAAFQGPFAGHWWILAAFIVIFYFISAQNLLRKDKEEV
ncbi:MAG: ABC transporter permease, partial [Methanobacterium sp.]